MTYRQLHAGQLRYHDFSKLREARNLRQLPRSRAFVTHSHSFGGTSSPMSTSISLLVRTPLSGVTFASKSDLTGSSPLSIASRPFFASAIQGRMGDFRLKQLERLANHNPTSASAQYDFLSELSVRYPEMVIERFENYPDFAIDDRCTLLYFGALQRLNGYNRFNLHGFIGRMVEGSAGGNINPVTIQALQELAGKTRGMSKGAQANAAMQIVAGAGIGGFGQGAASAAGAGVLGSLRSVRGSDPRYPLHIQMENTGNFRTGLVTLARQVLLAFVLVSAVTVLFDEKGVGRAMGMTSNHVQEAEGSEVRFEDVKGVEEAKAELEEIVLYLKDPKRFTRLGGKLPRGLLLTGPPGTGKTLLAKAIAGEADVPFFFASGSQFDEVYVGVGAKRIRDLFEAAKKKAPAIVFIDEIDAVGGSRKLKDQSALKMTLNELLVQLDGFEENNGIIVIGATNFAESLDKALLRPGRFDKHVSVPLPDVGGRKEILEMYATKTKLAEDVDLNVLARGTTGFSGADLYNLMNQAALKASVDGLEAITSAVLEYAKDKILMGAERKTAVITAKSARKTAFHEAGHALIATLTEGAMPVHKATIMPRGHSLGMVTMLPEGDQTSQSKKEMLAAMDVSMGGRVAEELVFGKENACTGASSDIQNATRIARAMVTKYGFSREVGVVSHGGETGQRASNMTRATIDDEVKKLTDASYERATEMLKKYRRKHRLLAETLLEYETLTGDEVRKLVTKGIKPDRPVINTRGGAKGDPSIVLNGPNKKGKPNHLPGVGKVGTRRESKDS